MSELTSHHDNLRDQIGQALNDAIASGAPQADYCDSREVDRLADAVMPLVEHLERQRANLLRRQGETFDQMAARRRARIDAAQARGETPPRDPAPGYGGYFDPLWLDADDDSPLSVADATLAAQAPVQGEPVSLTDRAEFTEQILLAVAEIPDRDSPADQPEMMLVTREELSGIIANAFETADDNVAIDAARKAGT